MATKVMNGLDLQNQRILAVASPSSGTDAVNKDYVDAAVTGLSWKTAVRAATTANGALATAYENGDSLDGVTLATGDRILLKNQTAGAENGIYTVNASGAPTRVTDADSTAELRNATVFVREGTANADTAWVQTAEVTTVGTTAQVWAQFGAGGGSSYTFGDGLVEAGGDVDIELGANSGLSLAGGTLAVASTLAGAGLTLASGVLAVGDGGVGITVNADDVALDFSVVVRKQAFACAAATSTVCNHNFGTRDVTVMVYRNASPWDMVLTDVEMTDTNNVTVKFASAPAAGDFRIVVHG